MAIGEAAELRQRAEHCRLMADRQVASFGARRGYERAAERYDDAAGHVALKELLVMEAEALERRAEESAALVARQMQGGEPCRHRNVSHRTSRSTSS